MKTKIKPSDMTYVDYPITKSVKQEDGTLMIYGLATNSSIDADKQICDKDWLAKAMPKWFEEGGNLREQHNSKIAAGVAKTLENIDGSWYLKGHIVDQGTVLKVDTGVLKSMSIGIRNARVIKDKSAVGGRIVDGIVGEVSVCDKGSNPDAYVTILKSIDGELEEVNEVVGEIPDAPAEVAPVEVAPDAEAVVETPAAEAEVVVETPAPVVVVEATPEAIAEVTSDGDTGHALPEDGETGKSWSASEIIRRVRLMDATGHINKEFDQGNYDMARKGLAGLLASEAGDLAAGQDEGYSIRCITNAIGSLFDWKMGEAWEIDVELALKSNKSLGDDVIQSIIEKAVKSATDAVRTEIDELTKSNESVVEELNKTQAELVKAQGMARQSTIRKAVLNPNVASIDKHVKEAARLRTLAQQFSYDPDIAKSYYKRAQAEDDKAAALNK